MPAICPGNDPARENMAPFAIQDRGDDLAGRIGNSHGVISLDDSHYS